MPSPSLLRPTSHALTSSDIWGIADNGAPLVHVGNLAAYTAPSVGGLAGKSSPAQTAGIRLLRQDGTIALDPIANILDGVMTLLYSADTGHLNQAIPAGSTAVLITGSTASFTLAQTQTVLVVYSMTFDSSGNFAYGDGTLDGSDVGSYHVFIANGLSYNSGTYMTVATLGPGAHTATLTVTTSAGITSEVWRGAVTVFQMGG